MVTPSDPRDDLCGARRQWVGARVLAAIVLIAACTDRVPSTAPIVDTPAAPPSTGRLRGTVDLLAGTLTFEPITTVPVSLDHGGGISAAIYGDQGVTVRIYNSPVVVAPAGAGKKRYSASVGLRNLLSHRIGDEQVGPAAHNLGIFVFVSAVPTVTGTSSPCSTACTVSVVGQHGIFAFSNPGQRYWYWPEQLAAAGQLGDTTTLRKTWTFEADTQVTTFEFEVLVSAAWPPPHDTRWSVNYGGDSLPNDGTEPSWVRTAKLNTSTAPNQPSVGMITITTPAGGNLTYFRIDSLNTTTSAYIEARFRVTNAALLFNPEVSFGIDDQVKFIAVGVNNLQAGFLQGTGSLAFQSGAVSVGTTSFHTYQLRKFASDSAVLYIDGVRRIHKPYSALPPRLTGSAHGFYFGPLGTGSGTSAFGNTSIWDHVIYEIGASQP